MRFIFAEQKDQDVKVNFRYTKFDAAYTLPNATLQEFEEVIKTLRDSLAGLERVSLKEDAKRVAIQTEAVTKSFLKAVELWPHANSSDIWWFIIYRAYCDPYNHPAKFARTDLAQSWKRTGGWALERVLVQHYGPFLRTHGINLFIADAATKTSIVNRFPTAKRLVKAKIDVMLTGGVSEEFFGVVHVKTSFAERRTNDQPMSSALVQEGYTSPLWTLDCKSTPSPLPTNRGELGPVEGRRSEKRLDIEDNGYFTGCFSYNRNTIPSPDTLPPERRVFVCDFQNPDDAFSSFIIKQWQKRLNA